MPQSSSPPEPTPAPHHLVTVESIAWASVLEFVHLFRGFRMAIAPGKIVLAMLGILALCVAGWLFDAAWGPQVLPGEISLYQNLEPQQYARVRGNRLSERASTLADMLSRAGSSEDNTELARHPRATYRALTRLYRTQFFQAVAAAQTSRQTQQATDLGFAAPSPTDMERLARASAAQRLQDQLRSARLATGRGVCAAFLDYELGQFDALINNTLTFVRMAPVQTNDSSTTREQAISGGLISTSPDRLFRSDTVVGCLANMTVTGPAWLFTASGPLGPAAAGRPSGNLFIRGVYIVSLAVLAAFFLAVVALVGGSICRLCALEFAGSPNRSLAGVFRYTGSHFWLFVRTPLLPFAILLVLGLLVAVVSLVGAVPWIGELVIGAGFIIFMVAGFIMMLLVLGILGGFNLLYPTLAAEDADSFDAMSRAFAYVYTRPWKLIFYTVISLIYGMITFLFVSFAVFVILRLTHTFVGWGMGVFGHVDAWYAGTGKLAALWPVPRMDLLAAPNSYAALSWSEAAGAAMIHFWVFLLLAALAGYVVSFYFSSNTIIYFLLRRSCDGQPLSDVYEPGDMPPAELHHFAGAASVDASEAPAASLSAASAAETNAETSVDPGQ